MLSCITVLTIDRSIFHGWVSAEVEATQHDPEKACEDRVLCFGWVQTVGHNISFF